jgi:hypothetical protein
MSSGEGLDCLEELWAPAASLRLVWAGDLDLGRVCWDRMHSGGDYDRSGESWGSATSLRRGCAADACSRTAGTGGQKGWSGACSGLGAFREAVTEAFAGSEWAGADGDGLASVALRIYWQLTFSSARRPCDFSSRTPFFHIFGSVLRPLFKNSQDSLSLDETRRQTGRASYRILFAVTSSPGAIINAAMAERT